MENIVNSIKAYLKSELRATGGVEKHSLLKRYYHTNW